MTDKGTGPLRSDQPKEKVHDTFMFWADLAQDVLGLIALSAVLFLILLI